MADQTVPLLPKRNNPFVPCGEDSEWVMSSYGHMPVLEKEGPLSHARILLIWITVVIGLLHFLALGLIWIYHKNKRVASNSKSVVSVSFEWDMKVMFWLFLSGIGRYYHFIDNHSHPELYHDGGLIYCGVLFAATDGFIPFQVTDLT
jgi:hypothetical protein